MAQQRLYKRADDGTCRGRHLRAACQLTRGQLIFAERPLLALQSLDNIQYNGTICHGCKAFCGGPDALLIKRFCRGGGGEDNKQDEADRTARTTSVAIQGQENEEQHCIVPCRSSCGHIYCSAECERDTWRAHHRYLCTGDCESNDAPIVQFKRFAVETNEILLLVAEWWVAQHTADKEGEKQYVDFQMNPWWDVVTADLLQQPGGFGEAAALQSQLRQVCDDAAALLNRVFLSDVPKITASDIAVRIGACEQNAMGIRQRSPLCRNIFDEDLRKRRHAEILSFLEDAGFIGSDECCDDEGNDGDKEEKTQSGLIHDGETPGPQSASQSDAAANGSRDEDWDYSVDEIASFLANLHIDEDGSVRDEAVSAASDDERRPETDDLDLLFPPLDGTAMYSIACKMNHSCDPNVIVVYRSQTGWGRIHPLAAFCVALRDIQDNEELTISYIDAEVNYETRQTALDNYGFRCSCFKCEQERKVSEDGAKGCITAEDITELNHDDPFGGNVIDANEDENLAGREHRASGEIHVTSGEKQLQNRLNRLDSLSNLSRLGKISLDCLESASSFVVQTSLEILSGGFLTDVECAILQNCCNGITVRDFVLCKLCGLELAEIIFNALKQNGKVIPRGYLGAYWCAMVSATLGLVHSYDFLGAKVLVDKATKLGLPRSDIRLEAIVRYVDAHGAEVSSGPYLRTAP
jgi:SET domain